jgi:hypothetical protein
MSCRKCIEDDKKNDKKRILNSVAKLVSAFSPTALCILLVSTRNYFASAKTYPSSKMHSSTPFKIGHWPSRSGQDMSGPNRSRDPITTPFTLVDLYSALPSLHTHGL